jgi:hypothetical protein
MSDFKVGDKIYAVYPGYLKDEVECAVIEKVTKARYYINGTSPDSYSTGLAFKCHKVVEFSDTSFIECCFNRTPAEAWKTYIKNLQAKRESLTKQVSETSDRIQKAQESLEVAGE